MARKKKSLWDDVPAESDVFVTNPRTPHEATLERTGKVRAAITYVVAGAAVLAIFASLTTLTAEPTSEDPAATSLNANTSLGKAAALAAVTEWMGAEPAPVPGGEVLSWDGFEPLAAGEEESGKRGAETGELHYFTVAAPAENTTIFYTTAVLVRVDDLLGASVQGSPSLMPRTPSASNGWSSEVWPGYKSVTVTDPVREAVTAWSKAFTGTPAELRLAVGDKNAERSYVPLTGASIASAEVSSAAAPKQDTTKAVTEVLARITLDVAWGGSKKSSPATYDVLVADANTAAPRVVAWGPAGTGPRLSAYGNAVTGTDVKVPAPTTPETPTPNETKKASTDG